MDNAQIYVFISLIAVSVVGSLAVYLAIKLDKANRKIAELLEPPF